MYDFKIDPINPFFACPLARQWATQDGARGVNFTGIAFTLKIARYDYERASATVDLTTGEVTIRDPKNVLAPLSQQARDEITAYVTATDFPTTEGVAPGTVPPIAREHPSFERDNLFEFIDPSTDKAVFWSYRFATGQSAPDGKAEKVVLPISFWSDGKWRFALPNCTIPEFNEHACGKAGNKALLIVEGEKAARAVLRLQNPQTAAEKTIAFEHPWRDWLQGIDVVGWYGGAFVARTKDWAKYDRIGYDEIVVMPDNDFPGARAAGVITAMLESRCSSFQYSSVWGSAHDRWDIADPLPERLFKTDEKGRRRYVGLPFGSYLVDRTKAYREFTVLDADGEPKVCYALNEALAASYVFLEASDRFIHVRSPNDLLDEVTLYNGHADTIPITIKRGKFADDLKRACTKSVKVRVPAYAPQPYSAFASSMRDRVVVDSRDRFAFNVFTPGRYKANATIDPQPWLDYLAWLYPIEADREFAKRWYATLLARPDIHVSFGLLNISTTQGVGKSLCSDYSIKPLVGSHNCVNLTNADIENQHFNEWRVGRRLGIVDELVSNRKGLSDNLKELLTSTSVYMNNKGEKKVDADTMMTLIINSNASVPFKLDPEDRRWFVPELREEVLPYEKAQEYKNWLVSGGLQAIMAWAVYFGDYIAEGERPMMTERKKRLIRESKTQNMASVADLAEGAITEKLEAAIPTTWVKLWLESKGAKFVESESVIRDQLAQAGLIYAGGRSKRVTIAKGQAAYVLVTPRLAERLDEPGFKIQDYLKRPEDLFAM